MFDNTLSVCMIVKNEEKNIGRCLESVKEIADEIIVVDTGSTDNTINIAKTYGAKITFHKWNNDFSDARNVSLNQATKNWILFLDADEEINKEEGLKLKNILKMNPHLEAFYLRLTNIIDGIDIGNVIVLRVFKNNLKYRFEGKMHEQVIGSIELNSGIKSIGSTDINIKHYGYDPNITDMDAKQKRNMELLLSYREDQRDGYFYYSLGNEYARIEDYKKALECYYKGLDFPIRPGANQIYVPYLCLNILKVLSSEKRHNEEIDKAKEFQKKYKNFKDLYFMECLAQIECNKFSKAKDALMKYLNCPNGSYEYPCSKFENHYDIKIILENLNNLSINHEEKLLSILILEDEDKPNLIDTIKSINEIAYEVIVVTKINSNLNKENIKNIGTKIIELKDKDKAESFISGCSKCRGKYILLMKSNELCSLKSQQDLIELLNKTKSDCFNLTIFNENNNIKYNEFRLFKNAKSLKKIKKFTEYEDYIKSKKIKDTFIVLQTS